MIERILNKLGLFTRKQHIKLAIALVKSTKYVEVLEDENKKLRKEIEKLRLKIARSVKRRRK